MPQNNIFELAKDYKSVGSNNLVPVDGACVSVHMVRDSYGYYIETVDSKLNATRYNPVGIPQEQRPFIESYNKAVSTNTMSVDWGEKPNNLYLEDYYYLVDKLVESIALTYNGTKFSVDNRDKLQIRFYIFQEENGSYSCKLQGLSDSETIESVLIISPFHSLAKNKLHGLDNALSNIDLIPAIITNFEEGNLSLFLSILSSYISTHNWALEGYQIIKRTQSQKSKLQIVIERVDEEDNLYIRIGQSTSTSSPHIDESLYELSSIVDIDHESKTATISPHTQLEEQQRNEIFLSEVRQILGARKSNEIGLLSPYFVLHKELAKSFVVEIVPALLNKYEIFGVEKLKAVSITTRQPTINASLSAGIDYFEGDVEVDFGDEKIDLFEVLKQWKKQKYIKLSNGKNALLATDYIEKLERLFSRKEGKSRLSFFDLPLAKELLDAQLDDAIFASHRSIYDGFNEIKPIKKFKKVKATLRDYQKYGVAWLQYLDQNKLNGCLADDMGLGKTLQALTLLAGAKSAKASLIIMPRTLLYNWEEEITKFVPHLSYEIFYGNDRAIEKIQDNKLILTTYGVIRNDIELLKEIDFHYIILDESQNIKNINAKTTKAVFMLKSAHRLALSGTPLENNLGELYSLFRFLNPAMFGSEQRFNKQYIQPIQKYNDEDVIHALKLKIYPFILRRLKRDVLAELPEKIENVIYVDQSAEQNKLYEQRRQFYKAAIDKMIESEGVNNAQFFIFQAFSELRQLASIPESKTQGKVRSPKLDILGEHMIQSILNGHKVLIFANFLAAIEHVSQMLTDHNIHHVTMTGATTNRQKVVTEFKQNPNCKAFVMTLKTGGTGLNLTEADIVYIFDPWWNGAAETQAIDRAHRIGQKKTVISYRLITKGTIEEKILELQNLKKELFDNLISSDKNISKSLSPEDIAYILQ